jgi:hypothetical protein
VSISVTNKIIRVIQKIRVRVIVFLAPILSVNQPKKNEPKIVGICPKTKRTVISNKDRPKVFFAYIAIKRANTEKALLNKKYDIKNLYRSLYFLTFFIVFKSFLNPYFTYEVFITTILENGESFKNKKEGIENTKKKHAVIKKVNLMLDKF